MPDPLAVDTNAVVDFLPTDRVTPPALRATRSVALPLPVLGELYAGASLSQRKEQNLAAVGGLLTRWRILIPDESTARIYGDLSAGERVRRHTSPRFARARRNDLWIVALCLQHGLPLLSNDRDFDGIEGLEVIHW